MSNEQSVDYSAVLADLRAKRDKIDAAIAGIEAMLGIASAQPSAPAGQAASATLGPGAFLGMTIAEAAAAYLAKVRENKRTEDIVSAIRSGGVVLQSSNPVNTVGSILLRDWNNGGEIVRVSRGVWGLASWHPRLRQRRPIDSKNGNPPETSPGQPDSSSPTKDDFDIADLVGDESANASEPPSA